MSKLDQLRALREVRGARRSPANPDQDVARQHEHRGQSSAITPSGQKSTGTQSGLRVTKRGRPRLEDVAKTLTAVKPWVAAGMSRRTWYRRRSEVGK